MTSDEESLSLRMPLFRKNSSAKDFSTLGVDFHNHLLPGLDDGSPSLEESLKMLRLWVELGYRKVIATPHVNHAAYPNTKERILGQMYNIQDVIEENDIPLEIEASAEYQLDSQFLYRMEAGELMPIGEHKYLLIEFSFSPLSSSVEDILKAVLKAGYKPILAHPERYNYLSSNYEKYEALKESGLLFQLNMNSLNGTYGRQAQKTAEHLIKADMIEFACTDAHHAGHLMEVKKLLRNRIFLKLMGSGKLKNHLI